MPHPPTQSAVHLHIRGRVQGVGFRFFAQDAAQELGLSGWVRNAPDGSVEAYGQGRRQDLEAWIERLRQGPPLARVEAFTPSWQTPQADLQTFSIR